MEPTQTEFNLASAINAWEQTMQNGALTTNDIIELTQHLNDEVTALKQTCLNDEEAWLVARHRIGRPIVINEEFSKVNPDFAANRNWLMLFWGGTLFMLLQTLSFALPSAINVIFNININSNVHKLISAQQAGTILYTAAAILIILALVSVTKVTKLSYIFFTILERYTTIVCVILLTLGQFIAFINYNALVDAICYHFSASALIFRDAWQTLGVALYAPLLFCTAWFSIRFRKQVTHDFKSFSINIDWQHTLVIGLIFEWISISSRQFSAAGPFIAGAVVFFLGGVILSRSRQPFLYAVVLQIPAVIMLLFALLVNASAWIIFVGQYCIFIISFIVGYLTIRNKMIASWANLYSNNNH